MLPPVSFVGDPRFEDHVAPAGHPERPERLNAVEQGHADASARNEAHRLERVRPRAATHEELARVHDERMLRILASTRGAEEGHLDADTYYVGESFDVAALAAGTSIELVRAALRGDRPRAFAAVRPPGHHAEANRAMGFCLLNNVAIAVRAAQLEFGRPRILLFDWDVHHGNGTQHMFERDPSVLYVSTHQYPFYPGTGDAAEIGVGDGRGFTINVPLEAGSVNEDYRVAFAEVIVPALRRFKPDLILVSAGFDAHERDPLGGMRLTSPAFAAMTHDLRAVADEHCAGRLVAVTEGGYDLKALAESLRAVVSVLGPADAPRVPWPPADGVSPTRGRAGVAKARNALAGHLGF